MAARVGLLLRALQLLLWGGLDAQLAERVGQELRREAEAPSGTSSTSPTAW